MSIYYVAPGGSNENTGELDSPFKTINYAAHVVKPGDQVLVHEGTYREWVNPEISGTATAPITFMAVPGDQGLRRSQWLGKGYCRGVQGRNR